MFYYVILALTLAALVLCRGLLKSRLGYYWLAIREDQEAAQAVGIDVFRYKLIAVVISAALTAPAGVFYAFFYNNMYPEQIFSISRSIEIILGAIVGGIGTLFGPILGAFILTPLGELITWAIEHAGINAARRQAAGVRRPDGADRRVPAQRHLAVAGAPPRAR